jgi:hypothetical protein
MSNTIKYKLDDFENAEECVLIGIISSAPDYSVCWHINKQLELNLSRAKDISFATVNKSKKEALPNLFSEHVEDKIVDTNISLHHVFKYLDEYNYCDYFFIANKGTLVNLEPSLKRVNYFLEIIGNNTEIAEELVFSLNAIEPIEMAYLIGTESIINKLQLLV